MPLKLPSSSSLTCLSDSRRRPRPEPSTLNPKQAGGSLDLNPSSQQQQDALAAALAELLWSAGSGTSASVALPPSQERGSGIVHEQLMRGGTFIRVTSKDDIRVSGSFAAVPLFVSRYTVDVVFLVIKNLACSTLRSKIRPYAPLMPANRTLAACSVPSRPPYLHIWTRRVGALCCFWCL